MGHYDSLRELDRINNLQDTVIITVNEFKKLVSIDNIDDVSYIVQNLTEFCSIARLLRK